MSGVTRTTTEECAATIDSAAMTWRDRVGHADWNAIRVELDSYGCALTGPLLTAQEADDMAALYADDTRFRATVNMGRHRFGEGEYRYFAEPFPDAVVGLKQRSIRVYCRSPGTGGASSAAKPRGRTAWTIGWTCAIPPGRPNPTPILLKYGAGDWNAWHRDLYGDLVFPLQVVINLSDPGVDHTGGEFLLYEQRPRAQSRAIATLIPHRHGLVFTTRDRPVKSTRGWSAAPVRHGVSVIRSGQRITLALVFHDAA